MEHHLDGMSMVNQSDEVRELFQRHESKLHRFTFIYLYQVLQDVFVGETHIDGL